ncbi:hypothetical protein [Silvibacterium dinghuense]|uniref:MucB/RseB N-terminal domain-containing protein n=1 Tax=Silvibacterium dinghuense TaxID=1560006 RepID=A0A4Q1SA61_9BACT|nr:hypothetical protein [Silvibacterium dinghuense]RXS93821.1 hypothetical protein ESZ00_17425 [Silvibacterium dinghuense]GGH07968.1 hypothetical protein GCM10011586_25310 [Silvibacterium dinghuense]
MAIPQSRVFALQLCALAFAAAARGQQPAPLPDVPTLMSQVEARQRQMDETRENYTYREITITRTLNKDGSIKKTETEENEVFYVHAHRIDRLVRKDGKDLSPGEAKKEQDRVMKDVEKAENTPPGQPINGDNISVTRLLEIMQVSNPRRELLDNRPTIRFDFTGNPHAKTHGRAEDASKKLAGTLWVDEQDRQVRRLEAHFDDNFHMGFGLFSIGKGSSFVFDQKLVNPGAKEQGLWLPTDGQAHLVAHAIGFLGYRADVSFSDDHYQRFHAEAQQVK